MKHSKLSKERMTLFFKRHTCNYNIYIISTSHDKQFHINKVTLHSALWPYYSTWEGSGLTFANCWIQTKIASLFETHATFDQEEQTSKIAKCLYKLLHSIQQFTFLTLRANRFFNDSSSKDFCSIFRRRPSSSSAILNICMVCHRSTKH